MNFNPSEIPVPIEFIRSVASEVELKELDCHKSKAKPPQLGLVVKRLWPKDVCKVLRHLGYERTALSVRAKWMKGFDVDLIPRAGWEMNQEDFDWLVSPNCSNLIGLLPLDGHDFSKDVRVWMRQEHLEGVTAP